MSKWLDKYGFIHDKPIDKNGPETSENGPLFSAVLHSLGCKIFFGDYWRLRKDKRIFRTTPVSVFRDSHFSFDNMLGVYYSYYRFNKNMKDLPILWWYSRGKIAIRQETIFFYIVQNPDSIFKKLIYYYLRKTMQHSLKKPFDDTNGKHKWWLRCQMLPPEFLKEATQLIDLIYHDSWFGVFNIYYRYQQEHPIIMAAKERFYKDSL